MSPEKVNDNAWYIKEDEPSHIELEKLEALHHLKTIVIDTPSIES